VAERDGRVPGAAGLQLMGGAVLLRPDEQVFAAMLEGWRAQQLARNLAFGTIGGREAAVRAFARHADAFPRRSGARSCSTSGWATCERCTGCGARRSEITRWRWRRSAGM